MAETIMSTVTGKGILAMASSPRAISATLRRLSASTGMPSRFRLGSRPKARKREIFLRMATDG